MMRASPMVLPPLDGGGLRTGASCSWDLKKICNWFAVKGPVRSSSAKLRKVNKADKLDGGEGGKWGESLVARTLGV
ncbi:hypothetical protein Bca101_085137 [Brassica carinata]